MPATGSIQWIHGSLSSGDRNATCWHVRARFGATRKVQSRVELAEVREARNETDEIHRVRACCVAHNYFVQSKASRLGDGGQVGTIVGDRDHVLPRRSLPDADPRLGNPATLE
jgi:hypothetical protein